MRGKVHESIQCFVERRITPAYAGKSTLDDFSHEHLQDHPRLCGEKSLINERYVLLPGSPPPMRGKEKITQEVKPHSGITPAYAGKS